MMIAWCVAWVVVGAQAVQKPPGVVPPPVPAPVPIGVQPGDRVTVHFSASTKDGRELADTERRALPFTFVVGGPPTVRVLDAAVRGMTVGDNRTVEVPESEAFGAEGVPPIVPAHAVLVVKVRLLKVVKAPPQPDPTPPHTPDPPPGTRDGAGSSSILISKRYQNDIVGLREGPAGRISGC